MSRWLFGAMLLMQAHFAASFLVPLDSAAQREFGGLLKWAWPWSEGDSGPLGQIPGEGTGLLFALILAMIGGAALIAAVMAVFGIWVPQSWWRVLTIAGALCTMVLFLFFPGLTKIIPLALGGLLIWIAYSEWYVSAQAAAAD
jgi:hypothetical protein